MNKNKFKIFKIKLIDVFLQKDEFVPRAGFTLIEMMVSISLFLIVVSMSLASFMSISSIQNKTISFRTSNDSLNFALESMAREIRVGYDYCNASASLPWTCNGSINSSTNFVFKSVFGSSPAVKYELSGNRIYKNTDDDTADGYLTPEDVVIEKMEFIREGDQPRVTIVLTGYSGVKESEKSVMRLQTTVSQRKPNI